MTRRASSLGPYRGLLLELRAGAVPFAAVARAMTPALQRRAGRVLMLWGTTGHAYHLSDADLVQEQLVVLWRAVDSWDPARGADIVRYVDAELGRGARAVLRRACGYPDPRRSSQPARRVEAPSRRGAELQEEPRPLEALRDERVSDPEELVGRRQAAQDFVERMPAGFDRTVVELCLAGASLQEAGRAIYADPRERIRYRLDSEEIAERSAERVALKLAASAGV